MLATNSQWRESKLKAQLLNRKDFVRAQFKGELPIRPPWSIEESRFTEMCTRCYVCAESCPSQLIVKGRGGFPEMSFTRHGCDYCEACVKSCPENALTLHQQATLITEQQPENKLSAWQQTAVISEKCFSTQGIVCRACGEICESRAIEFKLAVGGISLINLNIAACDGCGECVHVCPAHAIKINKLNTETIMETIHE